MDQRNTPVGQQKHQFHIFTIVLAIAANKCDMENYGDFNLEDLELFAKVFYFILGKKCFFYQNKFQK